MSLKNILFLIMLVVLLSAWKVESEHSYSTDSDVIDYQDLNDCSTRSSLVENPRLSSFQSTFRCDKDEQCPIWARCSNKSCVCALKVDEGYGAVQCDAKTLGLSVMPCYCLTYDNITGQLFAGYCIESCYRWHPFVVLPSELMCVNYHMCEKDWNRAGRLCGHCKAQYFPLAYSFDIRCVKCDSGTSNIWKLILVAFGPLTLFYFVVLFFKINATRSHLHGYLIFSQTISLPSFARLALVCLKSNKRVKLLFQITWPLYSMWNLDILRGVYSDIFLDVSTLTLLSLDYAVAVYPILLIFVSYILIKLHERNCRLVVFVWKPFRRLFTLCRRNWDIRTSVIDVYATFFLFSFFKVLNVSFDLLLPRHVYELTSGNKTWLLNYDGTVVWFGQEHLPYAILAILFCLTLTIIPTLILIIYPFRWFQRVLSFCRLRNQYLHALMDSFQGFYKDGTEPGVRDCRQFSALNLVGCMFFSLLYAITLDSSFFIFVSAFCVIIILLLITVQPYKVNVAHYTKIDAVFWGFLAICSIMIAGRTNSSSIYSHFTQNMFMGLIFLSGYIPLIYMTCITIRWIFLETRKVREILNRIKAWKRGYNQIGDHRDIQNSFADRVNNPEQYNSENLQESAQLSGICTQREEFGDSY